MRNTLFKHHRAPGPRYRAGVLLLAGITALGVVLPPAAAAASASQRSFAPRAFISSVIVDEGDNAVFSVRLFGSSRRSVTVRFFTEDGSAIGGRDYDQVRSVRTFRPGTTRVFVSVDTFRDFRNEGDESFFLHVSVFGGSRFSDTGRATIIDVDRARPCRFNPRFCDPRPCRFDPRCDPKPDPRPCRFDPRCDPKPDPRPCRFDPRCDPKPDPRPCRFDPQCNPAPDPRPDPRPGPFPDPRPGPFPDPRPGPFPDPRPGPFPAPPRIPAPDPAPLPAPDPAPLPAPDPAPLPAPDPGPLPAP